MPRLRVLRLLDFDNWHSSKPSIDHLLSSLKHLCPDLTELAVSAGLLQLKTESYGLITMLGVSRLTVQGDTSLVELPTHSSKQDYLTGEVVVDLLHNNPNLVWLKVENCRQMSEEKVQTLLEIASQRPNKKIVISFHNCRLNLEHHYSKPSTVKLTISRDLEDNPFDANFSDSSASSWASTDSESIHLWHNSDDDDDDNDDPNIIVHEFFE